MIVVNGRFLTQRTTGVQRFAAGISRELAEIRDDLLFVTPDQDLINDQLPGAPILRVGRFGGHLWEQVDLPAFLRRHRSPLLLNLTSTGPIRYRPQISTHHDITYVKHPDSFAPRFRALYSVIVPPLVKRSEGLITVSEFSRGELAEHFDVPASRFDVIHNGVDDRFSADATDDHPRERRYLLAVSSPNAHKNFDRMVEAFTQFSKNRPDIELVVVGAQAASFTRQHFDVDKESKVTFVGRVDDDELASLYRGAVAFVFPSVYEGFGIPPIEAQQCGCAVIASNAASMPEVLGDSALLFDPFDVESIASAMARVVDDDALREKLRAAGEQNVQRFSWADSARLASTLIDRVSAKLAS